MVGHADRPGTFEKPQSCPRRVPGWMTRFPLLLGPFRPLSQAWNTGLRRSERLAAGIEAYRLPGSPSIEDGSTRTCEA